MRKRNILPVSNHDEDEETDDDVKSKKNSVFVPLLFLAFLYLFFWEYLGLNSYMHQLRPLVGNKSSKASNDDHPLFDFKSLLVPEEVIEFEDDPQDTTTDVTVLEEEAVADDAELLQPADIVAEETEAVDDAPLDATTDVAVVEAVVVMDTELETANIVAEETTAETTSGTTDVAVEAAVKDAEIQLADTVVQEMTANDAPQDVITTDLDV